MIEERTSNIIYILKAFAIISVVCAHISLVPETFSDASVYVNCILNEIGAIGVGIFFVVAGYLFGKQIVQNSFADFIKKKAKTIGIPWVISSTLVYMYISIRKGGTILGWVISTLGYMSSYWYLTVFCILSVLFFFIKKSENDKLFALLLAAMAMISVLMRAKGIIPQDCFGVYLNIFNWGIFFSIGYLYCKIDKYNWNSVKSRIISIVLTVMVLGILLGLPILKIDKFSYFSYIYIPIEIAIIYILVELANSLSFKECKILKLIGKLSFSIYLYNELLWAGLIVNIGNRMDCWVLLFTRPILVLCAVIGELMLGRKIFSVFKRERLFDILTGVRLK